MARVLELEVSYWTAAKCLVALDTRTSQVRGRLHAEQLCGGYMLSLVKIDLEIFCICNEESLHGHSVSHIRRAPGIVIGV